MKRHVQADLIHQWAEGAEIEFWNSWPERWMDSARTGPPWESNFPLRVKPGTEVQGKWTTSENIHPRITASDILSDSLNKAQEFQDHVQSTLLENEAVKEFLNRMPAEAKAGEKFSGLGPNRFEKTTVTKWLWAHKHDSAVSTYYRSEDEFKSLSHNPEHWIKCEWSAMEFPK